MERSRWSRWKKCNFSTTGFAIPASTSKSRWIHRENEALCSTVVKLGPTLYRSKLQQGELDGHQLGLCNTWGWSGVGWGGMGGGGGGAAFGLKPLARGGRKCCQVASLTCAPSCPFQGVSTVVRVLWLVVRAACFTPPPILALKQSCQWQKRQAQGTLCTP